jgi:hypothetical protein
LISLRVLRADFENLSNGVLYYPILISFAWFTYYSVLGSSKDQSLPAAASLLAIFVGSLTSIATERQDRVADRITIELGGPRKRLATRMTTLVITNSGLVCIGLLVTHLQHSNIGPNMAATIASALAVIVIVSTLGVIVSSYVPHPIVAMAITFVIMSWGGSEPSQNWGLSHILAMLKAQTINEWWAAVSSFAWPWLLGTIALSVYSRFAPELLRARRKTRHNPTKVVLPFWLNTKRSFLKTTSLAGLTNLLPLLSMVICLGLYCYGTLNLGAQLAAFSIGSDLFPALPGLLLANVLPALILAGMSQRRDVVDQESLLYQSQRKANLAQVMQQATFIFLTLCGFIILLAQTLGVAWTSPVVGRSIVCAMVLSPGFATIGVYINRIIRLPVLAGLISYALTLPEVFLGKFIPESRPYLPSSLFSILVGGDSSYTRTFSTLAIILAYVLAGVLALTPLSILISKRRCA